MVFENFNGLFANSYVGKTDDNIIADTTTLDASYSKTVHFNMISKDVTAPDANDAFVVNMDPVSISLEQFQEAFYSCFDNYSYNYNTTTNQDIYKLRKKTVCNKKIPFLKIVLEFYKHELGCDQLSPETEIKITNELANINDIRYICKKNSHTLTWKSLFNALLEQNDDEPNIGGLSFLKKNHLFKLIFRVHNNDTDVRDIHFVFNFVVDFNGTSGLNTGTKKYETSIKSIVDEGGYDWT